MKISWHSLQKLAHKRKSLNTGKRKKESEREAEKEIKRKETGLENESQNKKGVKRERDRGVKGEV